MQLIFSVHQFFLLVLQGASIGNQCVSISRLETYVDESFPQNNHSWKVDDGSSARVCSLFSAGWSLSFLFTNYLKWLRKYLQRNANKRLHWQLKLSLTLNSSFSSSKPEIRILFMFCKVESVSFTNFLVLIPGGQPCGSVCIYTWRSCNRSTRSSYIHDSKGLHFE